MSPPQPLTPFTGLPSVVRLSVVLLAGLTVALIALLWPHWTTNPDLSHGLFMPVIFLLLLRESRAGTFRFLPDRSSRIDYLEQSRRGGSVQRALIPTAFAALLLAGLLALAAGGLYAASLGWSHDLVAFMLTGALVLLLAAGLLVFARDTVRFVPFNWSALVDLALWLLCAPIPPGTYTRLTLGLQLMVTENVLRALHLLGIAAVRHGNILELSSASVGIEEACSGVRSLISCVFAGLFFSASLVRRPWSRALLIALSAPLALAMNFLRSLTLTLLANSGVHIAGLWHDVTGFAVLAVTAALLAGLALLLERKASGQGSELRRPSSVVTGSSAVVSSPSSSSTRLLASATVLAAALAVAVVLVVVFFVNTRPALRPNAPVPSLAAILPLHVEGWSVETAADLYQFSDTLHTDHLVQRTYSRMTDQGREQITVYLAYWRAGQASVSLVSSHTPDACWPGAGWDAIPIADPRVQLTVAARQLPEAEARSFRSGEFPQNVWFWHLYDGRPITQQSTNSPAALLRLALRYGFRHDGDQLFVRVSSNRPWDTIAHEPMLDTIFARLQPLGL